MGLDVVGPGTGLLPTNDDWHDLTSMVEAAPEALNRDPTAAYALGRMLRDDPYTETWIAHRGGTVVGFVALHLGHGPAYKHTARLRLHVFDGHRREGVGSRLIAAALSWADAHSVKRITATPYMDGSDNIDFFFKHGFMQEGMMWDAVRVEDEYLDVAMLARVR